MSAKRSVTQLTPTASTPAGELQKHLDALKLGSVSAYRLWCKAHGFGSSVDKDWQQRRREIQCAEKLAADSRADALLQRHWVELGFGNLVEYERWCLTHEFSRGGVRTAEQMRKERQT